MGAAVDDHEKAQGALQLGSEQIPETGRAHRPSAQGAAQVKSLPLSEPSEPNEPRARREPSGASEPTHEMESGETSDPGALREPPSKRASRPISIPHDPTESQLHQSVAQLLGWILKPPAFFTTFPAGWGRLSKGTAGRLFASGLKKGMPDILVFDCNKIIGVELKVGRNDLSSAQRDMFAKLQAVGITVYTCRDQHGVVIALRDAGISHHKHSLWENT